MEFYISRNGQRFGPYTLSDVQADLTSGTIAPTDLAWYDGAPGWLQVSQIRGLALPVRRVPPPPPVSPPPPPPPRPQITPTTRSAAKQIGNAEIALLMLLILLIPPAGLVIGIMRLSKEERRTEGWIFTATSLLVMFCYAMYFAR